MAREPSPSRGRRGTAGLLAGLLLVAPGGAAAQSGEAEPPVALSLEQAVAFALEHNRDLGVARLDLTRAGGQVREAWGGLLPEVEGTLQYRRNVKVQEAFLPARLFDPAAPGDELVPVRFGADNTWVATLSVTQPLFDAAVFIGVGTASRFRSLQEEVARGRAHEVASAVRRAYLEALLARERLRVTRNSLERVERTLEETRAMHRVGLASDYDVLRLEVQVANLEPRVRREENEVAEVGRNLALRLGLDDPRPVEVAGELHTVDLWAEEANSEANLHLLRFAGWPRPLETEFPELYAAALRMRPEVRQRRLEEELERARLAVERSELLPRLSAFFEWDLTAQENDGPSFFGEGPEQRTTSARVGVQLEVPIFSGFRRWARADQQAVRVRQAEVRLADLERRVENDIRTALEALEETRARARAQRRAVEQAARGYEIVTAQYRAGTSSRLEVTDAEVALREAELGYAQAVHDWLAARAALDQAVGVVPVVDPVRQGALSLLGDPGEVRTVAKESTERG